MERRLVSQLVAAVTAKLAAGAGSNFVPRLTSGTVTDAGTRPTVVLDSTGTAVQASVDTNNGVVIGEFTWDGVDTGRFFRHLFPTAGVAEFGSGFSYVVDPEPGAHTVTMDGTATGATGTFLGATSPGYLLVEDIGPIGGTMA